MGISELKQEALLLSQPGKLLRVAGWPVQEGLSLILGVWAVLDSFL